MKRRVIIIVALVFVLIFIAFKLFSGKKDQYVFDAVKKSEITETVSESGALSTNSKVGIFSPTNGVVEKIFVSNGDNVTEKQKLFTVKSTATPQEKTEAYSLYVAAKSTVQQAENNRRSTIATVNRVHDDVKDHDKDETFLQKEARTAAEVANDNAWDALLVAKAQLASAQTNYYATLNSTVTAPIAGVISNLSVVPSSNVSVNNLASQTSPVLIIDMKGDAEVLLSVGESDINKIKINQEASIKFDAIENKVYKGVVVRYDESGIVSQGVAKFNVYLSIIDTDEKLKPGMNCDVDIITNTISDALTVPNSAIKPYQKGRALRILDDKNNVIFVPVKIGIKGKETTQILDGVSEGQQIIVSLSSEKAPKTSFF